MITETFDSIYDEILNVYINKTYRNGILYKEEYFDEEHNKINEIYYKQDGITIDFKYWILNGEFHRDGDLPAVEQYFDNKTIKYLAWYQNGKLHRDGDLHAVEYYYNYKIWNHMWYKNGKLHRDGDLPAAIWYRSNGKTHTQMWFRNGKIHRDNNLPACVEYLKDGKTVFRNTYYMNDIEYKSINA